MSRALLAALLGFAAAACASNHSVGPPPPDTTGQGAFLDTLEQRTFGYFWDKTNPANGLTPDRWPTPSFSSIAAVGFALTAYPIGVERGYVPRADAAARVLTTLRFFWTARQDSNTTGSTGYHGFFYHFLDMTSGARFQTVELSTIDTALLLAGVLTCQSYFDNAADPGETEIRALAESIYTRTDWQWAASSHPPAIALGWHPENQFIPYDWKGYNEAMIIYILALGSPTHPADTAAWTAWTSTYTWGTFEGQSHLGFAPLFGHQYSHVWIDFRGIQDPFMRARGINYFENSRRAAYAQRAYAIANPGGWKSYGVNVWGLTASDGPADVAPYHTYFARGASFTEIQDDGTIAPTAAAGSIAFAPEIAIPALRAMRSAYGSNLFATYGFLDAFNPTFTGTPAMGHVVPGLGWFDTDYLGIDQGPTLAMVENYRSDLIWRLLRGNPHVVLGLCRAGFTGGWLAGKCP
ncbi:MAG: Tat pathway signal protein [Gemmatimonadetes bacterium]|nr:MAG: Tat pathway signal protein [Gemmatimonadota bacterium]